MVEKRPLKVGVVGCAGRMGRMLVAEIVATPGLALGGGTEIAGNPVLGSDVAQQAGLPAAGLVVGSDPRALFKACDAVVDFTLPAATAIHADFAAEAKKILIAGTTGLTPAQQEIVTMAATRTAIVQSANMSVGVNILLGLAEDAARRLTETYDIEIVEMHHRHKVDSPSGTALALGRAAAKGRGVDLDSVKKIDRDGARRTGDIGFAVLRGGDVAGEHSLIFAADGVRFELTHRAGSRRIFAKGAARALLWSRGRKPGLYSMRDVLGLG